MFVLTVSLGVLGALLLMVAIYDLVQTKHAILRNFPIIGHLRYILEAVGPELRQYIVTDNDEERPFSRDQRRWVYASAKRQNNYFGFGTDNDLEFASNYMIANHSPFPVRTPVKGDADYDPQYRIPCAKVLGAARDRALAFRPASVVNLSAMSYGSLSARAVEAINRGCAIAGCLHNTGEGGVADHHRHGGELVWQLGTGYFGARAPDGGLSYVRLAETAASAQVRAIELKLSQGAKPGLGGVLLAEKITDEIAEIRGIPMGADCLSPPRHAAFGSVDEMLDVVEKIAEVTGGLPVGIKSAVGSLKFWEDLADAMVADPGRGVDYIAIDGGEGGTGAAPLVFSDHVSMPFKIGMARVYRIFAERDLTERIVFMGSGKCGYPENALLAFALGCDTVQIAREAMLAVGCIQAQKCHSGHCPTGVATQNRWLVRGLDPTDKGVRLANYIVTLRKEVLRLCHALGCEHPALICPDQLEILDGQLGAQSIQEKFGYQPGWATPRSAQADELRALMSMPV